MQIELNIGLNVESQPGLNSAAHHDQRAARALQLLAPFLVGSERFVTEYQGPDGQVSEASLFARLDTNKLFAVTGLVYRLAVALEQDCISVFYVRSGIGALIGPQAAKWGSFDPAYFRRIELAPVAAAA